MTSRLLHLALRLGAALTCSGLPHRGSAQAFYSVTDLGALGTGTLSQAFAINNAGQIVGLSYTNGLTLPHATLYQNGALTDLGLFPNGGSTSSAHAINDAGVIVGLGHVPSGNATVAHGFSTTTNGAVFTDLGTLGGGVQSDARGVASNGVIVGQVTLNGVGEGRAFSYSNGMMTNLGDPSTAGGLTSNANGVSVVGGVTTIVGYTDRIVGSGEGAYTVIEAFTHTVGGGMVNIGSLGNGSMGSISKANAISSTGIVVGESSLSSDNSVQHAFRYTLGGTMTDLGTLGGDNSFALAVNSNGLIVGDSELVAGDSMHHAFSLTSGGRMTDLNMMIPGNSGWTLIGATGVNDSGQIVGYGAFNGAIHGYLLTAIPEGANWAAVLGFLALLGGAYHRRQRVGIRAASADPGSPSPD